MKPHKKLEVWQRSFAIVIDLYRLTGNFPTEEKFGLVSQIRRAAISIPTNIAEGATRKSKKEFTQFLYVSAGSTSELDTLLLLSKELKFCSEDKVDPLFLRLEDISRMIFGLIRSIELK